MSFNIHREIFFKIPLADIKTVKQTIAQANNICIEVNDINAVSMKAFLNTPNKYILDSNIKSIQEVHSKATKLKLDEIWKTAPSNLIGFKWYWEHIVSILKSLQTISCAVIAFNHGKVQERIDYAKKLQTFTENVIIPFDLRYDSLEDLKLLLDNFDMLALHGITNVSANTFKRTLQYLSLRKLGLPDLRVILHNSLPIREISAFAVDAICLPPQNKLIHPIWSGLHRVAWTNIEQASAFSEENPTYNMYLFNAIRNFAALQNQWRGLPDFVTEGL